MPNKLRFIIILFFLLFGFINPASNTDAFLAVILLIYAGCVAFRLIYIKKTILLLLPFFIIFTLGTIFNTISVRKYITIEPIVETYRSDLDDFLRTYYLMEKGQSYYPSFDQAVRENAFKGYVAPNVFAWRLPTLFYIWKYLPGNNGISIFYAFLVLAGVYFTVSYVIAVKLLSSKNNHLAILAPYLLYPYLHFGIRDQILLHTEWWATAIIFLGLYALLIQKKWMAIIFLSLGLFIRELYAIPLLFLGCLLFIKHNKLWYLPLLAILFLAIFMLFHSTQVKNYSATQPVSGSFFNLRLHGLSAEIIHATLAFGAGEYLWFQMRPLLLFSVIAVIGVIFHKKKFNQILFPFLLFPISFLIIGSSVYNDYWSIFYIPFSLTAVPLALDI